MQWIYFGITVRCQCDSKSSNQEENCQSKKQNSTFSCKFWTNWWHFTAMRTPGQRIVQRIELQRRTMISIRGHSEIPNDSPKMYPNNVHKWHDAFQASMELVAWQDSGPNWWFVCNLVEGMQFVAMNFCKSANNCTDNEHIFYLAEHCELAAKNTNISKF